jgi:hypothetical protein
MVSELQLVRTDCVLARTAGVRTAYLLRTAYCVLCTAYCVLSIPGEQEVSDSVAGPAEECCSEELVEATSSGDWS